MTGRDLYERHRAELLETTGYDCGPWDDLNEVLHRIWNKLGERGVGA